MSRAVMEMQHVTHMQQQAVLQHGKQKRRRHFSFCLPSTEARRRWREDQCSPKRSTSMARKLEYGFFAVARAKGGIFQKADGSTERFEDRDEAVRARNAWLTGQLIHHVDVRVVREKDAVIGPVG